MMIGNITGTLALLVQFLQVASWCNNPDNLRKNGWKFYNGALYNSFDNPLLNHTEWESRCQQYGGSLVTIKNANENAFVYSITKSNCDYHIGVTFDGKTFTWNDDTPAIWTNWQSDWQITTPPYDCGYISRRYMWTADACMNRSAICKCSIAAGCNSSNPCSDPYAECTSGMCQCRSGYTLNGKNCTAAVGCNFSNPCSNPYEVCTSGICQCMSGYAFTGESCTAGLNSSCNSSIGCSEEFAECKATTSGINNSCQCKSNYSAWNSFCRADNGATCDECYFCSNPFASCNVICQCNHGYKTSGNLCKADVGYRCDETNGCSNPYADCTNNTCQCRPGYINTGTVCKADLNSSCTISTGCSDQYAECNVPTSETNGTCQCKNGYSAIGGICKADLNSSCNTISGCSNQYAECKATTPGANNTCQCKSNYTVVGVICKADLNSFCTTSNGCSDEYAECKTPKSGTNDTCQCKNTYSSVGGICKADTANSNTDVIMGVLIPVLFLAGIVIVGVFVFRYRYRHSLANKAEVETENEARHEPPMGEHNREVTKTLSSSVYSEINDSQAANTVSATVSQCLHCSNEEEYYSVISQVPEECAPRVDISFGRSDNSFHQSPRDKKETKSRSNNAVYNTSSVQCVNTVENESPKRTKDNHIEKLKDLSVEGKCMSAESKPVSDAEAMKTTDKVLKVKRLADNYIEFIHGELYDKPQEPKVVYSNDIGNRQNNLLPSTANASGEKSDKDNPVVFVYDYADPDGRTGSLPDGDNFMEDMYAAVNDDFSGITDDCNKAKEVFTYDYADQESSSTKCYNIDSISVSNKNMSLHDNIEHIQPTKENCHGVPQNYIPAPAPAPAPSSSSSSSSSSLSSSSSPVSHPSSSLSSKISTRCFAYVNSPRLRAANKPITASKPNATDGYDNSPKLWACKRESIPSELGQNGYDLKDKGNERRTDMVQALLSVSVETYV